MLLYYYVIMQVGGVQLGLGRATLEHLNHSLSLEIPLSLATLALSVTLCQSKHTLSPSTLSELKHALSSSSVESNHPLSAETSSPSWHALPLGTISLGGSALAVRRNDTLR